MIFFILIIIQYYIYGRFNLVTFDYNNTIQNEKILYIFTTKKKKKNSIESYNY